MVKKRKRERERGEEEVASHSLPGDRQKEGGMLKKRKRERERERRRDNGKEEERDKGRKRHKGDISFPSQAKGLCSLPFFLFSLSISLFLSFSLSN